MPNTGNAFDFATLEPSGVRDVALSPDQTRLYAAMSNGDINVYDLVTRAKIATWHVGNQLGGISVSTDGSLGADILTGGGGADTFRYDTTADSNSASMDHILDFTPGTDKIELSRTDANTLVAGDQAFSWIGAAAFTGSGAASAGQLRAYQDAGSWFVEGDTNGDGVADLVIALTLQGPTPLGAGDFFL